MSEDEVVEEKHATNYGYTQTVFGSFHENLREAARQRLAELRKLQAQQQREESSQRWNACISKLYWLIEKVAHINIVITYLFIMGFLTAVLCIILDVSVYYLNAGRQYLFLNTHLADKIYIALPLWILYTEIFVCLSLFFTHAISPTAAGAGIPEMKSILSGVTLSNFLARKTFFAKYLGLIASTSSGLIIGRSGPFVHIASILCHQLAKLRLFRKINSNTSMKMQMLAVACAVGMAGSRGAIVSGILFSIEVTSTYYPIRNYWNSFIAAFVSGLSYRIMWNSFIGKPLLSTLVQVNYTAGSHSTVRDWIGFVVLGVFMGFFAVCFVQVNEAIIKFRRAYANKYKILGPYPYALIIGAITAFLTFPGLFGPYVWNQNISILNDLVQNRPISSYGFLNMDWGPNDVYFTLITLIAVRFILQTTVLSVAIPLGVFSPLLVLGAAWGRLYGEALNDLFPGGVEIPAAFALAGAAGLVGGVTQTLSAAVFIFELTNNLTYSLGVLLVVIIAVGISKKTTHSIYDSIQKIKGLPFMPDLQERYYHLRAEDVMERNRTALELHSSIFEIDEILMEHDTSKGGNLDYNVPIVDSHENMMVVGAASIHALMQISNTLKEEAEEEIIDNDIKVATNAALDVQKKPSIRQQFADAIYSKKHDLRKRLGKNLFKAPIAFDLQTPIEQIHILFLTLRLKNAFVTRKGRLQGVITQRNLSKALMGK